MRIRSHDLKSRLLYAPALLVFALLSKLSQADPSLTDIGSDRLTPYWSESSEALIQDFNRDGLPDIFSVHPNFESRLFINHGDAQFKDETETYFPEEQSSWSFTRSLTGVDLDEDGIKDLILPLAGDPSTDPAAPAIAREPRIYVSNPGFFGQNPAPGTQWTRLPIEKVRRIFGVDIGGIGASLEKASRITPADFDGDGFPELFVQTTRGAARVLWSPTIEGILSASDAGALRFEPEGNQFANSDNQSFSARWARVDARFFPPNAPVEIWPTPVQQPNSRAPIYRIADARRGLISSLLSVGGALPTALIISQNDGRPSLISAQTRSLHVRMRLPGVWVSRGFAQTSQFRAPAPKILVTDLDDDGRQEVIVAEGSIHAADSMTKCGRETSPTNEACRQGVLHVYGFEPANRYFVDWMRPGFLNTLPQIQTLNPNESLAADARQKGFPNPGGLAAIDVDGDGVRDIIVFQGARSQNERIAIHMDALGIVDVSPPAVGPADIDIELHESYLAGKRDFLQDESYFELDRYGSSNSRPKILITAKNEGNGYLSFNRAQSPMQYLPEFLNSSLEIQSAAQVITNGRERLLLGFGFSLRNNPHPILTLNVQDPSAASARGLAISSPITCARLSGDQIPQTSVFPEIVAGDLNSDGAIDYLNMGVGQNAVYLGDDRGCFRSDNKLPYDSRFINQLVSGDIDGDGDIDIVGATDFDTAMDAINPNSRTVLYLNNGNGKFTDSSSKIQVNRKRFRASAVLMEDLNGDNKPDLLLFGNEKLREHPQLGSTGVHLLLNRSTINAHGIVDIKFETADTCLPPYLRDWASAAPTRNLAPNFNPKAADLNGDGRPDVILGKRKGSPDILFNKLDRDSSALRCGEISCRPDDIIHGKCYRLISSATELDAVPPGGPPVLTAPGQTGSSNRFSEVAVGDLDFDGKKDIVFSSVQGAVPIQGMPQGYIFNAVFKNGIPQDGRLPQGDWRLWFPLAANALPVEVARKEGGRCSLVADFDGDGKPDIFLAGPGECDAGAGHCAEKVRNQNLLPPWPNGGSSPWDFRAWAKVLHNQTRAAGAPSFSLAPPRGSPNQMLAELEDSKPGTQTFGCTAGDFNGDGCIDVYLVGYGFGNKHASHFGGSEESKRVQMWYEQARTARIYLNTCTRRPGEIGFQLIESERNPFKAYAPVSADFDGDGSPEIIQGGANQMHLFKFLR